MTNIAIMCLTAFCAGWFFGGVLMWSHFRKNHLIRSRKEWERAMDTQRDREFRKAIGKKL